MKIIILNKKEKEILINLLKKVISEPNCPYELTSILEKIDINTYEYIFNKL